MANAQIEIKQIEFIIEDELTHCNVFYKSSEPENPIWGGGWVTKTFPKSSSAVDILTEHVKDYISWNKGREAAK